ncbi:MAG: AzlD domain-containing protein [Pikeienuella sp.]
MIDQWDESTIWLIIVVLGIATYLIRFSFIGFMGGRETPEWALRILRFVPVTVLPALVAPAIMWPAATGGETDPARLAAACAALTAGVVFRNAVAGFGVGIAALFLLMNLT